MSRLNELIELINEWGEEKGILPDPHPMAQWAKTDEEVMELREAIYSGNITEAKDAIGDITVTLIMQCAAWNVTFEECLEQAYGVISKRTGKMVDGQFVKD